MKPSQERTSFTFPTIVMENCPSHRPQKVCWSWWRKRKNHCNGDVNLTSESDKLNPGWIFSRHRKANLLSHWQTLILFLTHKTLFNFSPDLPHNWLPENQSVEAGKTKNLSINFYSQESFLILLLSFLHCFILVTTGLFNC